MTTNAARVPGNAQRRAAGGARGFTLVEVLVALIVLAFGMMAIAGFQLSLSSNSDLAKQRTEATRLAQEKIEQMRSFEQIESATGKFAYADLTGGSDTPSTTSNATYTRTWTLSGTPADLWRHARVSVAWTDRANEVNTVVVDSVIARANPADVGALGVPPAGGYRPRRPLGRHIDIPLPAISIGGGRSTLGFGGQWLVFSDATGEVTALCATQPTFGQTDFSGCTSLTGYLLAGFINDGNINGADNFAWAITGATFTATDHMAAPPSCSVGPAVDPNNSNPLPDFLAYLCLVQPSDHDGNAATPRVWTGKPLLQPAPTGSQIVCRYNDNATDAFGVYQLASSSLDNQNYLVLGSGSCPGGTTQHQP